VKFSGAGGPGGDADQTPYCQRESVSGRSPRYNRKDNMRTTTILLCTALTLLSSCATMPTMPVRVTAQDSANWHADSLAWVAEVKRQQTDNQTRQLICMLLCLASLGLLPGVRLFR
jgi:hypothetical protein